MSGEDEVPEEVLRLAALVAAVLTAVAAGDGSADATVKRARRLERYLRSGE